MTARTPDAFSSNAIGSFSSIDGGLAALHLPSDLTERKQWVLYRCERREATAKLTKVPCTCQGYKASPTNPQHWSKYEYASKRLAEMPGFADGLGYVFTADDEFCGIDIDNAYPSDSAEMARWAAPIEERFVDTYREKSPSGTGFKIFCRAKAPRCGRWTVGSGAVEIYDNARFFTVTGHADDSVPRVLTDHQWDIELLISCLSRHRHNSSSPGKIPYSIGSKIPINYRHDSLVSLAGTLHGRGVCPEGIEAALQEVNLKQCDPPRSPEHIHRIVLSTQGWNDGNRR